MSYNSKAIRTDVNAKPIPQYYNPVTDEYEALQGTGGAARQVLYGPDGQPISVADNKLAVRAEELETKIEAVRGLLNTLAEDDFVTQTTLVQILEKMIVAPATEAKQDSLATLVGAIEDKLDGVRVLLNTLAGEDFATQTTLAQILAKLDGVIDGTTEAARQVLYGTDGQPISTTEGKLAVRAAEIEMAIANLQTALLDNQSTAAKQDALAGLIGALDAVAVSDPTAAGAVIALLKGLLSRLQTLEGKIDGITDGTAPAKTELTGSIATTISSPVTGIKTVTAIAAEVFAGATRKANRRKLIIRNESTALRFRIGKSDVTQQNGFPVEPGATIIFEFDPKTAVPIYAISEGAALKVGVCEE